MSDHLPADGPVSWLDKPENVRRFLAVFYVICGLSLVAELLIHKHTEHDAEKLFGFHGIYGFVGIAVLVVLSKQLRRLVMRSEDYYDG